ncbi:DUF3099 domain-containing protein [Arthrobacter sp. UM1]|uniref:DUF3099 domain-containing protein n=1 Tax=Arthrobacter sp. UM1 TaxID=2766776 RepID=UPI001CF67B48|nr:DUF3099 domain-containing protein [Arthrobacter sp. UM1]MCB4207473.1 DUF3099 domain-containing protein [Arthrobacter sp. UM1]
MSPKRKRSADDGREYVITSAPTSHAEDLARRRRNYVLSMTIRVVCLVLIFFVPQPWAKAVLAVGAIFIPYFAVVAANAGAEMRGRLDQMASYESQALPSAAPASSSAGGEDPRDWGFDGADSQPSASASDSSGAASQDGGRDDTVIVVEPERDEARDEFLRPHGSHGSTRADGRPEGGTAQ